MSLCESAQLVDNLLRMPLSVEQREKLASLDPMLGKLHRLSGRFRFYASSLCLCCLLVAMAAVLLALAFLVMLLAAFVSEPALVKLEPAIAHLGDRWLRLPMSDRCLVPASSLLPDTLTLDVFRRPVWDCEFCSNLTQVPRVSGVRPSEFYANYVERQLPVVVTDATAGWRVSDFSFEFFRQLYAGGGESGWQQQDKCQFFPYRTEFRDLREFFSMPTARANMSQGQAPWYVGWSNCDQRAAAELRSRYSRPYFLPSDAETLGTDWVFIGSPRYGAHMHVDNVGNPSWQAQIRGRKRWDLLPPLECSYSCQPLSVVVNPGEVFVLDTTVWYHGTEILDGDMSIAIGAEFD